jgi:hypothetical protein
MFAQITCFLRFCGMRTEPEIARLSPRAGFVRKPCRKTIREYGESENITLDHLPSSVRPFHLAARSACPN